MAKTRPESAAELQIVLNAYCALSPALPAGWSIHLGDREIVWRCFVLTPALLVCDERRQPKLVLDTVPPDDAPFPLLTMHKLYTRTESILDRLLVDVDHPFVEAARRTGPSSWSIRLHPDGELDLLSLTARLSLDRLYASVPAPTTRGDADA